MKCFVIAMQGEAKPVLDWLENLKVIEKDLYEGTLFNEKVAVIVCGVGKVNAACGAQLAIDKYSPEVIINLGVAGGLNEKLEVGAVYCIDKAVQYDFDLAQLNGTPKGTLNEYEQPYLSLSAGTSFPKMRLATADRFNDDRADFEFITKTLGADIRDMEGAAIAQVCLKRGVKCVAYKIISDIAGRGSTTEQFTENLKLCYKSMGANLKQIMQDLENI